jgi:cell division septation protein DedD
MSESNFREIQLNTKQVVFLFMACVVALLGVFLLGVQVGHGVSNDGTTAAASVSDPTTEPPVPTVLPSPTVAKPTDFDGIASLPAQGDGKGAAAAPATPPAEVPPVTTSPAKPAETPAPKPQPAPDAPAKSAAATSKPSGADKAASPTAIWYVQIDSFSSRDNADKQLATLKGKGLDAVVFVAPGSGARYKTRIGPMERNTADALKNRLSREGFKPTVLK